MATVTSLTCTTAGTGLCSISDVPFGDYWAFETTTPPGHDTAADQAVTVAPGGSTPALLTFVNPRRLGSVLVEKLDDAGDPLDGAASTVTGPGGSSDVMSSAGSGLFCLDGLRYGSYTVTETTVPAGYDGAPPQQVTVGTNVHEPVEHAGRDLHQRAGAGHDHGRQDRRRGTRAQPARGHGVHAVRRQRR